MPLQKKYLQNMFIMIFWLYSYFLFSYQIFADDISSDLFKAVKFNEYHAVREIIESDHSIDINKKDQDGMTPLLWACKLGKSIDTIQLLISNGASVVSYDNDNISAIVYAVEMCTPDVVEHILLHGASVKSKNPQGKSILAIAIEKKDYVMTEILLLNGADVNAMDNHGRTVLMQFINSDFCNDTAFIDLFVSYKPEIIMINDQNHLRSAIKNNCFNFLYKIITFQDEEIAQTIFDDAVESKQYILAHNLLVSDPRIKMKHTLWEALLNKESAIRIDNIIASISAVLKNINARDADGNTILMAVSTMGCLTCVNYLIEKGADINAQNNHNQTALMASSKNGQKEVVLRLIESGSKINVHDKNGWTALMHASHLGQQVITEILVHAGADIYAVNNNRQNAWAIAKLNRNEDLAFYLYSLMEQSSLSQFSLAAAIYLAIGGLLIISITWMVFIKSKDIFDFLFKHTYIIHHLGINHKTKNLNSRPSPFKNSERE